MAVRKTYTLVQTKRKWFNVVQVIISFRGKKDDQLHTCESFYSKSIPIASPDVFTVLSKSQSGEVS